MKLSQRKTKLAFETGATAYHAGKKRPVIIECENEFYATARAAGTQT